jgi:hypothetical protein
MGFLGQRGICAVVWGTTGPNSHLGAPQFRLREPVRSSSDLTNLHPERIDGPGVGDGHVLKSDPSASPPDGVKFKSLSGFHVGKRAQSEPVQGRP